MFIKYLQRTVFFMLLTLGLICLPSPLSAVTAKNVEANAEPFQPDPKDSSFAFDCVLLGGFIKGQWVNAENHQNNPLYHKYHIWGGSEWSVYSFNGNKSEGIVCAIHGEHEGEFEETEHEPPNLAIFDIQKLDGNLKFGSAQFAIDCVWNPVPRQAAVLPTDDEASLALVQNWLQQKGLPTSHASVVQAFRVDLDGDGQNELLVCAQNILTPGKTEATDWKPDFPLPKQAPVKSSRGQYSVILLGKDMQDADKTQAIPLVQFLALGNVRQAPRLHKLCYFADLNGDGTLEIIAGERQGKGLRYAVYTSQGKCVIKVPDRTADKQ